MALSVSGLLGRLAYGALFVGFVPALLWWWTLALPVKPPAIQQPVAGVALLSFGVSLMLAGMWALWSIGGGLPMNAFPPRKLVSRSVFAILPHPIYLGFVLACAGASLWAGSGAGLWVTTPLAALGCAAIVWGYEGPDLDRRFGTNRPRSWLSIPRAGGEPASSLERLGAGTLVLGLWLVAYEGVKLLGIPPDAIDARLAGEAEWPVWAWTEVVYTSSYVVTPAAFLLAPTRNALRRLSLAGLVATGVLTLVYLCVPLIAPPRPVEGGGVFGALLRLEHVMSAPPVAAWPSFHVLWAGLAAQAVAVRGRIWAAGAWTLAVAIAVSCVTTGMHALVDVVAGVLLWYPAIRLPECWAAMLQSTERLANAWRAWHLGPVRIINHGVYPGLAAFAGAVLAVRFGGDPGSILLIAVSGLAGAALWAQAIEGHAGLSRPFGYHGFVAGAAVCAVVLHLAGRGGLDAAYGLAVAAPLVQAVGRLRCIVQGCCHGRATLPGRGICVANSHSRVVAMGQLEVTPIHPTQLYSILANLAILAVLLRLHTLGMWQGFTIGTYLILAGLARFIEEAYRGEPQTRRLGGLAIYQWVSIASIAAGMGVSVLRVGTPVTNSVPVGAWLTAGILALAFWLAMGVDFPGSKARFSRLSG